jgi:NAD(P)-dependent dehydrogenase (short-subunit alcohol dehydrogenase family)
VTDVAGLRMLVTGAAGVLGNALAAEAAHRGAAVAATGIEPSISEASFPEGVHVLPADLADPAACRAVVDDTAAALGGLDVLVNNAAVIVRRPLAEVTLDELELQWAVNLRAPYLLMQAALPHLERSAAAVIVNVISTSAFTGGLARSSVYGMMKAGLVAATKAAARELGPRGIRVVCLSPPAMASQMQTTVTDEERAQAGPLKMLPRRIEVAEAVEATLFVASPAASGITGTTVDVSATGLA